MSKRNVVLLIIVLLAFFLITKLDSSITGEAKGGVKGAPTFQCNDHKDNDDDGYCDFLWNKAYCSDGSIPGDSDCISKDDNDEFGGCVPVCNSNAECGTNGYIGDTYCGTDGNVYRDYITYTCENAGKCSSNCNQQVSSLIWQNCDFSCSNGQCTNETPSSSGCTDTDGGKIYDLKGSTSNDLGNRAIDACFSRKYLSEFYCGANREILEDLYTCPEDCLDGACVAAGICSDIADGTCNSICDAAIDADCCANAGKYWLKTSFGYGCYSTNYNPGCYGGEVCSSTADNCCPNWCSLDGDVDCCTNSGKQWIEGKGCYSNLGVGSCTSTSSCSATSDNCCPSWCSAGVDYECCINAGHTWIEGEGCY